jgi:hypothetical protein
VGELDPRCRALGVDEMTDPAQGFDLAIGPQAKVFGGDPPLRQDRGRLGEHQPGPALGEAAQVHQMPVIGQPVQGGVLAHRGNHDAVGQGHIAQNQGFKQVTQVLPSLQVKSSRPESAGCPRG